MTEHEPTARDLILVTGASGYVGGRLVPRLLEAGYRVRSLARERRKLGTRTWATNPRVDIVEADAADIDALTDALRGCRAAFYLIHSMTAAGPEYRRRDRELATGFAEACGRAGVERIIYLGGLGETGDGLSEHLTSRREVERALASGPAPVTVLRAAMIIGSGSASFEILRYLVERLPIMVTPRWVATECQPIAIRNVLHYLVACLETPETTGRTLDIGGTDVVTYHELMRIMADALNLSKRLVIPVPVLTPRLSSLWIHLVTPLSHRIARPLAEGLRNRVVCRNDEAAMLMPQPLLSAREAIETAVGTRRSQSVETSWADAGPIPGDPNWAGGTVLTDRRIAQVAAPPHVVFDEVQRIGGERGYHAGNTLWRLRGWMDRMVGGPGLRRGRRDPDLLAYGEAVDFWRVTRLEPPHRLELRAEMKLPGEAVLEFDITPDADDPNCCRLEQTARFKPKGLVGLAYWYSVVPLHGFVFPGMLQGIRRAAEATWEQSTSEPRGQPTTVIGKRS